MSAPTPPDALAPAPDLLPCPFCGVNPTSRICGDGETWVVACEETDCGFSAVHRDSEKEAIAEWQSRRWPSPVSQAPAPPDDSDLQFRLVRALLIDAWGRAWGKHPGTALIRAALKTMVPEGLSLADVHALDSIRDADIAAQVNSTDPRDNAPGLRNHVAASQIGFVRERLERGEAIQPEAAQVLADWLTAALGDRAPVEGKGPGGVAPDGDLDGSPKGLPGSEASPPEPEFYEFNLNSWIRVRLNERGYQRLKDANNAIYGGLEDAPSITTYKARADKDGYSKFQAWEFMEKFGPVTSIGMAQHFETGILIESKDLTAGKPVTEGGV